MQGQDEFTSAAPHATVGNEPSVRPPWYRREARVVPLLVFLGLAAVLGVGLTLNPREVPSPLIGKLVPEFELPPVQGRTLGLASRDLEGEVTLVNVFARMPGRASGAHRSARSRRGSHSWTQLQGQASRRRGLARRHG